MASSVLAARPPEEVVMFRFWKEASEDAQELAAADHRLRGEDDAPESDAAGSRTPEADQTELDKSPPLLADNDTESTLVRAGYDGESPPMLAGDGQEPVAPQPTEVEDEETVDPEQADQPAAPAVEAPELKGDDHGQSAV